VINTNVIRDVLVESQAGKLAFPKVVRRLQEVGGDPYFVDVAKGEDAFYVLDGKAHVEKMAPSREPIAEEFSLLGIISAIRAAQRDTIRYPEFMKRAVAAGVIGYWAFLTGKKVIYVGRKGEFHGEEFSGLNA
jgi:uncharacterized protein YbcV (DUF1398 family)